jgi:hypothetical protein
MHTRFLTLLAAALAVALPAFSRVLSYAPYTTEPALTGIHSRTARHFVLLEGAHEYRRQAVLYDTRGEEEPRVVYPLNGHRQPLAFAAMHERADGTPVLLVGSGGHPALSLDGGRTWRTVHVNAGSRAWIDNGGPNTQPLWHTIQNGNDAHPFAIQSYTGIWVIRADGSTFRLTPPGFVFVGRDRDGTRYLVHEGASISIVDMDGRLRRVHTKRPHIGVSGWITPEGHAYIEEYRTEGRYLYFFNGHYSAFVAGPYDMAPLMIDVERPRIDALPFFAIPTHDFRGAWMIQRKENGPTTLLRHTPERGLETMWSDPAGPEVEALIAGNSGETVLIQVHVPREVGVETPFIDPALAVWRVGEPAPSSYDELYLNEEPNKGFIHVDVDAMAAGEPFVFNSGFELLERPIQGPISAPPAGGGADVVQEWGAVRASLKQRLVLPGVANTRGAFGTSWQTDVVLFNPLDAPQNVEVHYVAGTEQQVRTVARMTRTLTLAARETRVIPNVLNSLFFITNSGGTLFFTPAAGMNVFGRTYTRRNDGGTLGYGMQAIDAMNAAGPRFSHSFAGAFQGANFRTNVQLTDTTGSGGAARITSSHYGSELDLAAVALTNGGVQQRNGVGGNFESIEGALRITPTRGLIIPAVVTIDNRTNDATYFPPDMPGTTPRSIPVLASYSLADGTRVQSDLYLYNPTGRHRTVTLEAKQWGKSVRRITSVDVAPGQARIIRDALPAIFAFSGYARVRYLSNEDSETGEGVRVTSRIYTVDKNGGTTGCLVPPLNNFQIAAQGDSLELLGVYGGDAFRTNLGLVELSQANTFGTARVRVRIFDERDRELASFEEHIGSTYGVQLDDLFGQRAIAAPHAARITVENLGGGLVAAYATMVDKTSGDSTYLPANLAGKR